MRIEPSKVEEGKVVFKWDESHDIVFFLSEKGHVVKEYGTYIDSRRVYDVMYRKAAQILNDQKKRRAAPQIQPVQLGLGI